MAMTGASTWTSNLCPSLGTKSTPSSLSSPPTLHLTVTSKTRTWAATCPLPSTSSSPSFLVRLPTLRSSRRKTCFKAPKRSPRVAMSTEQEEKARSTVGLKDFLEDLKSVGRVRIIVNTGVAVLESVTNVDKLFYHTLPGRGEYANLMLREENVDFHLLIDQVRSAKLDKGKSSHGDIPTYMVRFADAGEEIAVSLLVMWKPGTNGKYDDGQVDAFESLLQKYGPEITFAKRNSFQSVLPCSRRCSPLLMGNIVENQGKPFGRESMFWERATGTGASSSRDCVF